MYCVKCGMYLPDDAKFCSRCGTVVRAGVQENRMPNAEDTMEPWEMQIPRTQAEYARLQKLRSIASQTLAWGILGVVFSVTIYLSLLGILFSALGLWKAGQFQKLAGPETGRAFAGKILSIIGLCTGIIVFIMFSVCMGIVVVTLGIQ